MDESDDDDFLLDHLDNLEQGTLVELDSKSQTESAKRKKKFVANYDIPGVFRVVLSEASQASIGVRVGDDVTGLHPWKSVKKELLLDDIVVYADESTLAQLKPEIEAYEEEDVLVGYIFDETTGSDEFHVCLSLDSKKEVEDIMSKALKRTMKRLSRGVERQPKGWTSWASERDVDDFTAKTTRPLIKVELKTTFPRSSPRGFSARSPDDIRDGYLELVSSEDFDVVNMQLIDAHVQAVPERCSSEAQTEPKFPQNVWTQCSVEDNPVIDICEQKEEEVSKEEVEQDKRRLRKAKSREEDEARQTVENLRSFLADIEPTVASMLEFNSVLDIYNIDFPALKAHYTEQIVEDFHCEEKMIFKSIRAKGKSVSSLSWHRFEPNIFAVAYSDASGTMAARKPPIDPVYRDVHVENPVLTWDIKDSLKPKLSFEADREVRTLSFCPFDPEILVGGCVNGQIILWDMMGKLKVKPDRGVVSETKKKFRAYVESHPGWMKEYDDTFVVRQAAASDPLQGHTDAVSDIAWLGAGWHVNPTGQMLKRERIVMSMQFMTVGSDACVLIWDLTLTGEKPPSIVNSKRVQMDLAELRMNLSKYKVFDNTLSPMYRVHIGEQGSTTKTPLTSMCFKNPHTETIIEEAGEYSFSEATEKTIIIFKIWLGTMYGDVFKVSWSGQELAPDEDLKPEYGKFDLNMTIHDGPITVCARNPFFDDIMATVGGKVFAVWSDSLNEMPLFWKRMKCYLTHLAWSPHVPGQIFVSTQQGDVDIWELTHRSDAPVHIQKISGEPLTGLYLNKLQDVMVVAGVDGSLKVFHLPDSCRRMDDNKLKEAEKFFERALDARRTCSEWQKRWYAKHAEAIERQKVEELARKKERDRLARLRIRKEQERQRLEEEMAKNVKPKEIDHEERWRKMQHRHAVLIIQEKKHLNKMTLLKEERPLKELEGERAAMSAKRLEIMKKQEAIFNETVSILFPEAIKKPPDPPAEISAEELENMKRGVLEEYAKIEERSKKLMEEARIKSELRFDWSETLARGKERRRLLGTAASSSRRCSAPNCPLTEADLFAHTNLVSRPEIASKGQD